MLAAPHGGDGGGNRIDEQAFRLDAVLNSLSHDDYIPRSVDMLKQGGCFLEIGKRGIWDEHRMSEARPGIRYEIIAIDSRMADDPAWVSGHLSQLSARVEAGDPRVAPLVVEQFDMRTQCVAAFQHLQRADHIGKVVVTIRPSITG